MSAFNEVQIEEMLLNLESIVRSDRVFENRYEADSQEVIDWTAYFYKRANVPEIFQGTWDRLNTKSKIHSEVIGTFWHHFSSLAPQIISLAAYKVSNNLMRHYIVQVLFEELGGRNHRVIHPDLFLDCLDSIGVGEAKRDDLVRSYLPFASLAYLSHIMSSAKSDSKILGILLGLEIDAEENIHTIANALSYNEEARVKIETSAFFRIHRVAESEHIRLDVSNFLRFCPTEKAKEEFNEGFDEAVQFWRLFWQGMNRIIDKEIST
jgi:hypothetical protein